MAWTVAVVVESTGFLEMQCEEAAWEIDKKTFEDILFKLAKDAKTTPDDLSETLLTIGLNAANTDPEADLMAVVMPALYVADRSGILPKAKALVVFPIDEFQNGERSCQLQAFASIAEYEQFREKLTAFYVKESAVH